jgi:hypothetical protein
MEISESLRGTLGRHQLMGDAVFMLLVAGSAFFVHRVYWVLQPPPMNAPLTITLALLAIIPLTWRWLFLIVALISLTLAMAALDTLGGALGASLASVASILAVFSSAAYGGRRRNLACAASIVTFNGGLIYRLIFSSSVVLLSSSTLLNIAGLIWNIVAFLATWWFGTTLRMSREQTSSLSASTWQIAPEGKENAHRALFGRCVRIAGKQHRILTLHIISIRIRASAAVRLLRQYPPKVLAWTSTVETLVRQTLADLRRLPGLLHSETQVEPAPSGEIVEERTGQSP